MSQKKHILLICFLFFIHSSSIQALEDTSFNYERWGKYRIANNHGGTEFFSGYQQLEAIDSSLNLEKINAGAKVVIDSDELEYLSPFESLKLGDEYSITFSECNVEDNLVLIELKKNSEIIEKKWILASVKKRDLRDSTFIHSELLNDSFYPTILVHISDLSSDSMHSSKVGIDGVFQIALSTNQEEKDKKAMTIGLNSNLSNKSREMIKADSELNSKVAGNKRQESENASLVIIIIITIVFIVIFGSTTTRNNILAFHRSSISFLSETFPKMEDIINFSENHVGTPLVITHDKLIQILRNLSVDFSGNDALKIKEVISSFTNRVINRLLECIEGCINFVLSRSIFQNDEDIEFIDSIEVESRSLHQQSIEYLSGNNSVQAKEDSVLSDIPKEARCRWCQNKICDTFDKLGGIEVCENCGHIQHADCIKYNNNSCCKCNKKIF